MPPLTFKSFLMGPNPPREASKWHPAVAFLAGLGVLLLGQATPIVAVAFLYTGRARHHGPGHASSPPDIETVTRIFQDRGGALLVLTQAVMALLTMVVASRYQMKASTALALEPPPAGPRAFVYALLVLVPLLAIINVTTYSIAPESYLADYRQFLDLVRGPEPWLSFAAIGIGAPMWEEMLFRGFLLPPLIGGLGFWPAALLVSAAWTALHIGYSIVGLAEVFLIGIYFAWLLRRTGSLWVPIACHAGYNVSLFLLMRFWT